MLKGLLEGCILKIISADETYGYKITEALNAHGFTDLNEGSVYPVLMRLEKKGLINSVSKKSPKGPRRKYFSITIEGSQFLNEFNTLWQDVSTTVNQILEVKQ